MKKVVSSLASKQGRISLALRFVSRGGDLLISNAIVIIFGNYWAYHGMLCGGIFNVLSDYFGHKQMFSSEADSLEKTPKRKTAYALLRILFAIPGFAVFLFLFEYREWSYLASSITSTCVVWVMSFDLFRRVFTGSTKDFPLIIQQMLSLNDQKNGPE